MEPLTRPPLPPAPPMPPEAASLYAPRPPGPPTATGWGTSTWGQPAYGQAPPAQDARILTVEPVRRSPRLLRPLLSLLLAAAVLAGAVAAVGWARNQDDTADSAAESAQVLGSTTIATLPPTTAATFPTDPEARFYLYTLANQDELNSIDAELEATLRKLQSIQPPSTPEEADLLLAGLLADTREVHRLLRRVIELLENAPDSPSRTRFLDVGRQLDDAYDELEAGLRNRDEDRLNRAEQLAEQAMQSLFGPSGVLS